MTGLLSASLLAPAQAVSLSGEIGNPASLARLLGPRATPSVWLSSFISGQVIARGTVSGKHFLLNLPDDVKLKLTRYEPCDGVKSEPRVIPAYQAETMLAYDRVSNRVVGPVIQADDPLNPTRTVKWMYSGVQATITGRCTGTNTFYKLTLRKGWNPIMTVNRVGRFEYTNVAGNLPYWVQGTLKMEHANTALPKGFFTVL